MESVLQLIDPGSDLQVSNTVLPPSRAFLIVLVLATAPSRAIAQQSSPPAQPENTQDAHQHPAPAAQPQHEHQRPRPPDEHAPMQMDMPHRTWQFMHDGILFANVNRQGGPRGDAEFKAENWWMGMAHRPLGRGVLTLSGMFSLDPATVGKSGYSEIFQAGEAINGRALIDRQHPHDFLMQLGVIYRIPVNGDTGFTVAAAPVGEPALGPVAFMHRPSAAENPTAPLGHHTFDSTHIAMGVITAALDRERWIAEGSVFRGREPDDDRWDLMDPGRLDSWSARLWLEPTPEWMMQVSHGFLSDPEEFEPGDVRRTTASVTWMRTEGPNFTAVGAGYGRNNKAHGAFNAFYAEGTRRIAQTSLYGRLEALQVETDLLRTGVAATGLHEKEQRDVVAALTLGAVRDFLVTYGFELGLGGDVTFYGVPEALRPTHGSRPVSVHVFVRVRPPAPATGRMWNMIMSQPRRHLCTANR